VIDADRRQSPQELAMKVWIFLLAAVAFASSIIDARVDAPGLRRPAMVNSIVTD
jgi:hypothetical protein